MNKQELIDALNEDLAREYAAAIQYYQHAAVIDGVYFSFAKELLDHAADEIKHAQTLNDHIAYLGGVPSVKVADIFTSSDAVPMLRQDLQGEQEAIAEYQQRVAQARAIADPDTEAVLLEILADEEHHANDLKSMLEDR